MSEKIESVFFGIMTGDHFGDVDPEDAGIDSDASIRRYAKMVEKAIKQEYGGNVEVDWASQDATGCVPYGLKTRVNGDSDHELVEDIEWRIIHEVWSDFAWVVYE